MIEVLGSDGKTYYSIKADEYLKTKKLATQFGMI